MSASHFARKCDALNWLPGDRIEALGKAIEAQPQWPQVEAILKARATGVRVSQRQLVEVAGSVAREASVDSHRDGAVVYAREQLEQAEAHVAATPQADVVHTTPAGAMLEMLDLLGLESPLTTDEAADLWTLVNKRFAAAATGNVTAFLS